MTAYAPPRSEPTPFTRRVGRLALVVEPLAFLLVLTAPKAGSDREAVLLLAAGALVLAVLWYVALLVRHAGHWWARPVLMLGLFSVASSLALGSAAAYGVAAATTALMLGVWVAGLLPRGAAALVLLSWPFEMYLHEFTGQAMGVVGHLWLAWALSREPLPRRRREGTVAEVTEPA